MSSQRATVTRIVWEWLSRSPGHWSRATRLCRQAVAAEADTRRAVPALADALHEYARGVALEAACPLARALASDALSAAHWQQIARLVIRSVERHDAAGGSPSQPPKPVQPHSREAAPRTPAGSAAPWRGFLVDPDGDLDSPSGALFTLLAVGDKHLRLDHLPADTVRRLAERAGVRLVEKGAKRGATSRKVPPTESGPDE